MCSEFLWSTLLEQGKDGHIMERSLDQKAETILWEISDKMDTLYDDQDCQVCVSNTVRKLMEGAA